MSEVKTWAAILGAMSALRQDEEAWNDLMARSIAGRANAEKFYEHWNKKLYARLSG